MDGEHQCWAKPKLGVSGRLVWLTVCRLPWPRGLRSAVRHPWMNRDVGEVCTHTVAHRLGAGGGNPSSAIASDWRCRARRKSERAAVGLRSALNRDRSTPGASLSAADLSNGDVRDSKTAVSHGNIARQPGRSSAPCRVGAPSPKRRMPATKMPPIPVRVVTGRGRTGARCVSRVRAVMRANLAERLHRRRGHGRSCRGGQHVSQRLVSVRVGKSPGSPAQAVATTRPPTRVSACIRAGCHGNCATGGPIDRMRTAAAEPLVLLGRRSISPSAVMSSPTGEPRACANAASLRSWADVASGERDRSAGDLGVAAVQAAWQVLRRHRLASCNRSGPTGPAIARLQMKTTVKPRSRLSWIGPGQNPVDVGDCLFALAARQHRRRRSAPPDLFASASGRCLGFRRLLLNSPPHLRRDRERSVHQATISASRELPRSSCAQKLHAASKSSVATRAAPHAA